MAENLCWQCYELCVYFPEILNIVDTICKGNGNATEEGIKQKISDFNDGYDKDKLKKLHGLLE